MDAIRNVKQQVTAGEWAVRTDLAAAYRLVAHYGCCLLYTSPSPRD